MQFQYKQQKDFVVIWQTDLDGRTNYPNSQDNQENQEGKIIFFPDQTLSHGN